MDFGQRLKQLRKDNDLTQEDLAELIDVSRQAVYKWEIGKGYPTIDKILFLKHHFSISLDDLFGEENKKMEKQHKTLWDSIREFYWNLSKHERNALIVMACILGAIFLFSAGVLVGESLKAIF